MNVGKHSAFKNIAILITFSIITFPVLGGIPETHASGTSPTNTGTGITITQPVNGANVSGTVKVTASVSYKTYNSLQTYFYLDGKYQSTSNGASPSWSWTTGTLTGQHQVKAVLYSKSFFGSLQQIGTSTITVTVGTTPTPT